MHDRQSKKGQEFSYEEALNKTHEGLAVASGECNEMTKVDYGSEN